MTTEYELTKDDLSTFNLYHHRHSPTARRQYLRSWFIPAVVWSIVFAAIWYLADRERGTPLQTFLDLLPLFSGVPIYRIRPVNPYSRMGRRAVGLRDGIKPYGKLSRPPG